MWLKTNGWNPKNWWFVDVFPFPRGHFQVPCQFSGVCDMLLIISCLVSYNFEFEPILDALDFFPGLGDFLIICFLFGPLPSAGMLFIAIHNSEKWFKLSFLLQLRNEAMVQWWLGNNLDDELWTSRERYCSSKQEHLEIWHKREVFEVSRIYRNHFDITFWNFIDLLIFSDSTVYSLFFIFSWPKLLPQHFSNNTSTKMVIKSPRNLNKKWCFPYISIEIPINFHRNSPIQPSSHPTRRLFQVLRCLQP